MSRAGAPLSSCVGECVDEIGWTSEREVLELLCERLPLLLELEPGHYAPLPLIAQAALRDPSVLDGLPHISLLEVGRYLDRYHDVSLTELAARG